MSDLWVITYVQSIALSVSLLLIKLRESYHPPFVRSLILTGDLPPFCESCKITYMSLH